MPKHWGLGASAHLYAAFRWLPAIKDMYRYMQYSYLRNKKPRLLFSMCLLIKPSDFHAVISASRGAFCAPSPFPAGGHSSRRKALGLMCFCATALVSNRAFLTITWPSVSFSCSSLCVTCWWKLSSCREENGGRSYPSISRKDDNERTCKRHVRFCLLLCFHKAPAHEGDASKFSSSHPLHHIQFDPQWEQLMSSKTKRVATRHAPLNLTWVSRPLMLWVWRSASSCRRPEGKTQRLILTSCQGTQRY